MPTLLGTKENTRLFSDMLEKTGGSTTEASKSELTYYVLADTIDDTKATILATDELPTLGSIIAGEKVISVAAKETNTVIHPNTGVTTFIWEIAVKTDSAFDLDSGGGSPGGPGGGVTLFRPVTRWSTETIDERVWRDVNTNVKIATEPGDPILVTRKRYIPVLEVKRYKEYPFDPNKQLQFPEHVNEKEFWGAPPGSALCGGIQVEEQTIQGTIVVWVTYIFKFKLLGGYVIVSDGGNLLVKTEDGWNFYPLHEGIHFREIQDGAISNEIFLATDESGNPKVVPLNPDGTIKTDQPEIPLNLEFAIYQPVDFDSLNLNFQDVITMQPGG